MFLIGTLFFAQSAHPASHAPHSSSYSFVVNTRQLGSQPCRQHTTTHASGWWFLFSGIRLAMIPKRGGAAIQDEEQWWWWWTGSRLWTGAAEEMLDCWTGEGRQWNRAWAAESIFDFQLEIETAPDLNSQLEILSGIAQFGSVRVRFDHEVAGFVWGQSSIPWCGDFIWGPGSLIFWRQPFMKGEDFEAATGAILPD